MLVGVKTIKGVFSLGHGRSPLECLRLSKAAANPAGTCFSHMCSLRNSDRWLIENGDGPGRLQRSLHRNGDQSFNQALTMCSIFQFQITSQKKFH